MVGLSIFIIERRTKEIGIRKINGASVSGVMIMLKGKFLITIEGVEEDGETISKKIILEVK